MRICGVCVDIGVRCVLCVCGEFCVRWVWCAEFALGVCVVWMLSKACVGVVVCKDCACALCEIDHKKLP